VAEIPDTYRSKSTIRLLGLLSAGPINRVQQVAIGRVPLSNKDGTSNFSRADGSPNVLVPQIALGNPVQAPFEGFSETESEFSVGRKVKYHYPVEKAVSGQDIDMVRVTVGIPRLMRQNPSTGAPEPATVGFSISVSSQGGPFQPVPAGFHWADRPGANISGAACVRVSAAYRTASRLVYIPGTGNEGKYGSDNEKPDSGGASYKDWADFADHVKEALGFGDRDSDRDVTDGKLDAASDDRDFGGGNDGDAGGGTWAANNGTYVQESLAGTLTLRIRNTASPSWVHEQSVQVTGEGTITLNDVNLDASAAYTIEILNDGNFEYANQASTLALVPWDVVQITEKISSAAQFQYSVNLANYGPAPWIVRLSRTTPDTTDTAVADEITFDSITEVQRVAQTYPGMAMVGMQLDAADFPNGIGERLYLVEGLKVPVFSNYDPVARTYTGIWDGRMSAPGQERWTENPALLLNGLVKSKTAGLGQYLGSTQVDPALLYRVAQYCDGLVPSDRPLLKNGQVVRDADGRVIYESEPRFTLGVWITERMPAEDLLARIGSVMRAITVAAEGSWQLFQDGPAPIEYVFNNTNVENGLFTYEGSDLRSRHSAAIVKYKDGNNYDDDAFVYVESRAAVKRYGLQIAELEAWGTRTASQARRYGRAAIFADCYPTDMVQFTTGAEGRLILPGKVFAISDVLKTGEVAGGRVVAYNPDTLQITLDEVITFATGSFISVVDDGGVLLVREVSAIAGQVVTVKPRVDAEGKVVPFTVAMDSPWSYGKPSLVSRRYVCVRREAQGSNKFSITASEVNPGKWNYVDFGDVPQQLDYEDFQRVLDAPSDLSITEQTVLDAGVPRTTLQVTWSADSEATRYRVAYRLGGDSWQTSESNVPEFTITNIAQGTVQVLVWAISAFGKTSASAASKTHQVSGKLPAPALVAGLTIEVNPAGCVIRWNVEKDLAYHVYVEAAGEYTRLDADNTKGYFDLGGVSPGAHTYSVQARNASGVLGPHTRAAVAIQAPAAPGVDVASGDSVVKLTCVPPAASYAIAKYVAVREGQAVESATNLIRVPVEWRGAATFEVSAVDVFGNRGAATTVTAAIEPPKILAPSAWVENGLVKVRWRPITGTMRIDRYTVGAEGVSSVLASAGAADLPATWVGEKQVVITAYDSLGQSTQATITVTVPVVGAPQVTYEFDGANCKLNWTIGANEAARTDYYQVEADGQPPMRVDGTSVGLPANWLGARTIYVVPCSEKVGRGQPGSVMVSIAPPQAPTLSFEFVGRNIKFSWSTAKGSLRVSDYVLSGASTATTVDQSVILPVGADTVTLGVVARDLAGNVGQEARLTVPVVAPLSPVVRAKVVDGVVQLTWTQAQGSLPVESWEVFGEGIELQSVRTNSAQVVGSWLGAKTLSVVALDFRGTKSTRADVTVTLTASDTTLAQRIAALNAEVAGNKASVDSAVASLTSKDSALAQRVDQVEAQAATGMDAVNRRVATVETKVGEAATASDLSTLSARLAPGGDVHQSIQGKAEKAELSAGITDLQKAIATATESAASRASSIEARLSAGGDVSSAIAKKADQAELNAVNERVSGALTRLDGTAAASDVAELRATVKLKGRNMLDLSSWIPGQPMPAHYTPNGTLAENSIVYERGPFGETIPIWRGVADGRSDADGGWDHTALPIDPTKTYRFTVWIKPVSGVGQAFLGTNSAARIDDGFVDWNPYFVIAIHGPETRALKNGRWYLFVGYRLAASYTGTDPNLSAVYDGATGELVNHPEISRFSWRSQPTDTTIGYRTYQYYATAGAEQWFALPRLELVDGNEPSVAELLSGAAQDAVRATVRRVSDVEASLAGKAAATDVTALAASVSAAQPSGGNLLQNSDLAVNKEGWTFYAESPSDFDMSQVGRDTNPSYIPHGRHTLVMRQFTGSQTPGSWYATVPVTAGAKYMFSVYSSEHRAGMYFQLEWWDANNTYIGLSKSPEFLDSAEPNGQAWPWPRRYHSFTAPAGAVRAFAKICKARTNPGHGDSWLFLCCPSFEQTNATVPGPYKAGSEVVGLAATFSAALDRIGHVESNVANKAAASDLQQLSARVTGSTKSIVVAGTPDKFYPVGIYAEGSSGAVTRSWRVSRPAVHEDGTWLGSYVADVVVRTSDWGNAPASLISVHQRGGGGTYPWGLGDVQPSYHTFVTVLHLRGGMRHTVELMGPSDVIRVIDPGADGILRTYADKESYAPITEAQARLKPYLNKDWRPDGTLAKESVELLPQALNDISAQNTRLAKAEADINNRAMASTVETLRAQAGRRKSYRLAAWGNSYDNRYGGNLGCLYAEDGTILSGYGRSYAVVIFNPDGTVLSAKPFDVWGNGEVHGNGGAAEMATYLNAIPLGTLVIIYSSDEPSGRRQTGGLQEAILRCGGTEAVFARGNGTGFHGRSVYILIGRVSGKQGTAFEAYRGDFDNDPAAFISVSFDIVNGEFVGISPAPGTTAGAVLNRVLQVEATVAGKAAATDVASLQARVGSAEATVTTTSQAVAALDGMVSGKWALAVEASLADGRRKVLGVQAFNDGTVSKLAISADQLIVQQTGSVLNVDPYLQDKASWLPRAGAFEIVQVQDGRVGDSVLRNTSPNAEVWGGVRIPFDPNKTYRVKAWARGRASPNGNLYVGLQLLDSFGQNIQGNGTFWYTSITPVGEVWQELTGLIGPGQALTPPASAKWFKPILLLNYGGTVGQTEVQAFEVEEVIPGTLIQGDTITTRHIAASGIQSLDFEPGKKGWSIRKDGEAEFTSAVFRGRLEGASGTFAGRLAAGTLDPAAFGGITLEYRNPGTYTITVPDRPEWSSVSARIVVIGGGGGGGGGANPEYGPALSHYYCVGSNFSPNSGAWTSAVDESASGGSGKDERWTITCTPQYQTVQTVPYRSGNPGATGGITIAVLSNLQRGSQHQITVGGGGGGGGMGAWGGGGTGSSALGYSSGGGGGGAPTAVYGTSTPTQQTPYSSGFGGGGGVSSGNGGGHGAVLIEFYDPNSVVTNTKYQQLLSWLESRLGTAPAGVR